MFIDKYAAKKFLLRAKFINGYSSLGSLPYVKGNFYFTPGCTYFKYRNLIIFGGDTCLAIVTFK